MYIYIYVWYIVTETNHFCAQKGPGSRPLPVWFRETWSRTPSVAAATAATAATAPAGIPPWHSVLEAMAHRNRWFAHWKWVIYSLKMGMFHWKWWFSQFITFMVDLPSKNADSPTVFLYVYQGVSIFIDIDIMHYQSLSNNTGIIK